MLRRKISTSGNSAALVLSRDLLGLMGVEVGDEVDIEIVDRMLIVRPVDASGRNDRVAKAIDRVVSRRAGLMRRLAANAEVPPKGRSKR